MKIVLLSIGLGFGATLAGAQTDAPSPFVTSGAVVGSPEQVLTPAQTAQAQFELGVRFMQDKKYAGAVDAFQKSIEARPDFFEAYNNWGISLVQLGKLEGALARQLDLYQQAADKFSKAVTLRPNERITYILWSETLLLIGDSPIDARVRLGCYQGAVEKCRKAVEIAPNEWEAYNKWAAILADKLGEFATDDPTRLNLYRESASLFAKAAEHAHYSSELGTVYANWGSALVRASRLTTDMSERKSLLTDASEKFERSARAVPGSAATYSMWGSALVERGKFSRVRSDFRDGIDRLNTSISLNPKDPKTLYNLACAYAIMDNPVLAVEALKKCFDLDTNKAFYNIAPQDSDLVTLRDNPHFQELYTPSGPKGIRSYNPHLGDR